MRVLVLGKAKTGTTLLTKTIQKNIPKAKLIQEPKSYDKLRNHKYIDSNNLVCKIIFEHWKNEKKILSNIVTNKNTIKFDKIVAVVRDPRDEFISRLCYFSKPYFQRNGFDSLKLKIWIDCVREKEKHPATKTVIQLISEMNEIFNINFFKHIRIVNSFFQFENNHSSYIHTIKYEDLVDNKLNEIEKHLTFNLHNKDTTSNVIQLTLRSGSYNNWKEFFTTTDLRFLKSYFKKNFYYDLDEWDLDRKVELDSKFYSQYIERISTPKDSKMNKAIKSYLSKILNE